MVRATDTIDGAAATGSGRTILHGDMDAFYASVEQRDRPELRGKPVIVGGDGPRGVVSTASYEARRFGVRSAMPGVEARRRCPDGIFVRPRMAAYVAVSEQVRAVFDRYTPLVEPLSLDEAFLDVTGSRRLFGDGPTIARRIQDDVLAATGLTISLGVASSKYVAKVASDLDKPSGLVIVPPGDEVRFLRDLPVSRLWGAGPALQRQLAARGFHLIGDIQSRGRDAVCRQMGARIGAHLYRLATGDDDRPVVPSRDPKSIGHEETFARDLRSEEECRAVLLDQSQQVGRRLRQAGVRAWTVRVKFRRPDFKTWTRQRRLPAATDLDVELHEAARALFLAAWQELGAPPLRLLGVTGADLVGVGPVGGGSSGVAERPIRQGTLFGGEDDGAAGAPDGAAPAEPVRDRAAEARLQQALDAIRDRHGDRTVRRGDRPRGTRDR